MTEHLPRCCDKRMTEQVSWVPTSAVRRWNIVARSRRRRLFVAVGVVAVLRLIIVRLVAVPPRILRLVISVARITLSIHRQCRVIAVTPKALFVESREVRSTQRNGLSYLQATVSRYALFTPHRVLTNPVCACRYVTRGVDEPRDSWGQITVRLPGLTHEASTVVHAHARTYTHAHTHTHARTHTHTHTHIHMYK